MSIPPRGQIESLRRRLNSFTTFVDVGCRLESGDSLAGVYRQLLLAAMGTTGAGSGAVFQLDNRGEARLAEAFGSWNREPARDPLPLDRSVRQSLEEDDSVVLLTEDVNTGWQELARRAVPFDTRVAVRLQCRKDPMGFVLLGERITGEHYGQEEKKLLGALARVFNLLAEKARPGGAAHRGRRSPKRIDPMPEQEIDDLRRRHPALARYVGNSASIRKILADLIGVATTDCPVLFEGESGTGKELLARIAHDISCGHDAPFEGVSCGAIPESLIESELFGHVAGAFTGATRDHHGTFERAQGGTVFLDEIAEMPSAAQVKLLRVLQEGSFLPVGGEKLKHCSCRIIAATNRDLQQEVEAGRFRSDLYYRLSVFPIRLPPLRERREDIPALLDHLLDKYSSRLGKTRPSLDRAAMRRLCVYSFPGNIREMQNIVRSLLVELRGEESIADRHVVAVFSRHRVAGMAQGPPRNPGQPSAPVVSKPDDVGQWVVEQLRRYHFNIALAERMLDGQRTAAANRRSVPVSSRDGLTYYLHGEFFRALARERWDSEAAALRIAGGAEMVTGVRRKLDNFLKTATAALRGSSRSGADRLDLLRARFAKLPSCYDEDLRRLAEEFERGQLR